MKSPTAKGPGGRPTLLTPETIAKLEQAYAYGCTDEEACLFADIWPSSLYTYQKRHPEFLERKQALKNKPFLIARKSVIESMAKDGELALKYLERKMKAEFSPRQEMEHSGNERKPVVIIDAGPNPYIKPKAE